MSLPSPLPTQRNLILCVGSNLELNYDWPGQGVSNGTAIKAQSTRIAGIIGPAGWKEAGLNFPSTVQNAWGFATPATIDAHIQAITPYGAVGVWSEFVTSAMDGAKGLLDAGGWNPGHKIYVLILQSGVDSFYSGFADSVAAIRAAYPGIKIGIIRTYGGSPGAITEMVDFYRLCESATSFNDAVDEFLFPPSGVPDGYEDAPTDYAITPAIADPIPAIVAAVDPTISEPAPDADPEPQSGARLEVRLTDFDGSAYYGVPSSLIESADWYIDRNGGYGQATLNLYGDIEGIDFDPQSLPAWTKMTILVDGSVRYVGFITRPAKTLANPVRHSLNAFGLFVLAGNHTISQNRAYGSPRDIAAVFSDIVTTTLAGKGYRFSVRSSLTGVTVTKAAYAGKTLQEAADDLVTQSANAANWMCLDDGDAHLITLTPLDSLTAPSHAFMVPSTGVTGSSDETDLTKIITQVFLEGGEPLHPNLVPNGELNDPIKGGNGSASLFINGSIEDVNAAPFGWSGTGSHKHNSDSGEANAYEGDGYWEVDHSGETLIQSRTGISSEIAGGKEHVLSFRFRNERTAFPHRMKTTFFWRDIAGAEIPSTRIEDTWYTTDNDMPLDESMEGPTAWTYREYRTTPPVATPAGGFNFEIAQEGSDTLTLSSSFATMDLAHAWLALHPQSNGYGAEVAGKPYILGSIGSGESSQQVFQRWADDSVSEATKGVYIDSCQLYDDTSLRQVGWEVATIGTGGIYSQSWVYPDSYDPTGYSLNLSAHGVDEANCVQIRMPGYARYQINTGQSIKFMVWLKPRGRWSDTLGFNPLLKLRIRGWDQEGNQVGDSVSTVAANSILYDGAWHQYTLTRNADTDETQQTAWIEVWGEGSVLYDCLCVRDASESEFLPQGPLKMQIRCDGYRADSNWSWQGEWAPGSYVAGSVVRHSARTWKASVAAASTDTPGASSHWQDLGPSVDYSGLAVEEATILSAWQPSSYRIREARLSNASLTSPELMFAYASRIFAVSAIPEDAPRVTLKGDTTRYLPGESAYIGGTYGMGLSRQSHHIVRVHESWSQGDLTIDLDFQREHRDEANWFLELIRRELERQGGSSSVSAGASPSVGAGGVGLSGTRGWGELPKSGADVTLHDDYVAGPHVSGAELTRSSWDGVASEVASARATFDTVGDRIADINSARVPAGGAAGKVLKKISATNYDFGWAADDTGTGLPNGGTTGQILIKNSGTDGDAGWQTPSAPATGMLYYSTLSSMDAVTWTTGDIPKLAYNLESDGFYLLGDILATKGKWYELKSGSTRVSASPAATYDVIAYSSTNAGLANWNDTAFPASVRPAVLPGSSYNTQFWIEWTATTTGTYRMYFDYGINGNICTWNIYDTGTGSRVGNTTLYSGGLGGITYWDSGVNITTTAGSTFRVTFICNGGAYFTVKRLRLY